MGLGIAATAAFLITLVTGVLLMFYYKPVHQDRAIGVLSRGERIHRGGREPARAS